MYAFTVPAATIKLFEIRNYQAPQWVVGGSEGSRRPAGT
jgi:hypothetical protein